MAAERAVADRSLRARPEDVLAAVLVYVPHLRGYFLNRLGVLDLCLKSLLRTKPKETPLLVFDNGCCEEVRAYLAELEAGGQIDYLVRSRMNLGTLAAIRMIVLMSPRPLLAYCDDDVFFGPGWLEAQLSLMAAFPEAGVVSGAPTLDGALHAIGSTLRLASEPASGIRLEQSHMPEEWEVDWALSTGRDPDERRRFARETPVPTVRRGEARAFAGATHFQFVGRVEALAAGLPKEWPSSLMGGLKDLDAGVDAAGYLRLSTAERFCRHIGNAVTSSMRREAEALGYEVASPAPSPRRTALNRHAAENLNLRGKLWTLYMRLGLLLDGEEIRQAPPAGPAAPVSDAYRPAEEMRPG
ncbi:MAG TPA: glycosyltransferase family A protein [Anaerolineales bacterium]|nr:glycosyltransferase family A protein [Anaerolineales bacterium]